MKIAVLTNGFIKDYLFYQGKIKEYDFIICADGGLRHAFNMDITPNIVIGDFDSTPTDIMEHYCSLDCEFIQYSTIKDETDTEIALNYALAKKPCSIDILAGFGNRFDHSLANVHLLKKGLEHNIGITIITENNEVSLIDQSIKIKGEIGQGVSLLPLSESVEGIYTKGLAYQVEHETFIIGKPYGVSNYMTNTIAEVTIKKGLLLIIKYRD